MAGTQHRMCTICRIAPGSTSSGKHTDVREGRYQNAYKSRAAAGAYQTKLRL